MTDPDPKPKFETDEIAATRGREQGLGVGARELAAQRDPGGVETPDGNEADIERDTAVQGADDDDEQLSRTSDA